MKFKLFFFLFLILGFISLSQTAPDRFIVHKVKKKETLYSLSKIYNVSIETIKEYNPLIDKIGLKRKMKLQIPFFKTKPVVEDSPELVSYKKHIVKPKETKWRLAYEYGLKISDLEKAAFYYEKALVLSPKHKGALEYQGEMFLTLGQLEKAESNLKKLEKICFLGCDEEKMLKESILKFKKGKKSNY